MNDFHNIIITDIKTPVTVFSKKGRIDVMKNRRCFGISLCIDGQITYTMKGENYVSHKGNAILLPKGETYTIRGDKDGLFPVINFDCEGLLCNRITVIPITDTEKCVGDFEMMKKLFSNKENRLKVYSLLYRLLDRIFAEQRTDKKSLLSPLNDFLENNYSDSELSNTTLAHHLGISEVYLRKLFVSEYGITPKQYIIDLRIKKAKQLLTDTNFTVTDISEKCGFSSLYHFCRVFKNKIGITPTQYAKNNKVYKI